MEDKNFNQNDLFENDDLMEQIDEEFEVSGALFWKKE